MCGGIGIKFFRSLKKKKFGLLFIYNKVRDTFMDSSSIKIEDDFEEKEEEV